MPKKRKVVNLPLVEIILASLIIHIVGLLILGGITIYNKIDVSEPELEAPPILESVTPPKQIPVQLADTKPPAPSTKVLAVNPQLMPLMEMDFDMPVIEQRSSVAGRGFGSGAGLGGGVDLSKLALGFSGIQDKSESVCFIVDYSLSMKDKIKGSEVTRFELLKEQLVSSLSSIDDQMMVSLIFFSGPAWIAGQNEKAVRGQYSNISNDWHSHRPKDFDSLAKPEWRRLGGGYRSELIDIVQNEKMSGGTVWQNPLRLARTLKPAPEVIYFLTDGATSEEDVEETLKLVDEWKKENRDLRIHTIALGEPKAASAMRRIAGRTGGKFRLIETLDDIKRVDNKHGDS
ncbi:vWA domain-containing protein [Cerasicoccus fimbriatus]|uniref:vWA domain-containing protein n=1 Tax=Cerasicoccus fimbriatus TaxID=3014554 RepID=UPI0022B3A5A1|nr:vWA domain-containing protein [Cerasicoccus sp. TK19100]